MPGWLLRDSLGMSTVTAPLPQVGGQLRSRRHPPTTGAHQPLDLSLLLYEWDLSLPIPPPLPGAVSKLARSLFHLTGGDPGRGSDSQHTDSFPQDFLNLQLFLVLFFSMSFT